VTYTAYTITKQPNLTTQKRDSHLAAYGGVVLQQFEFIIRFVSQGMQWCKNKENKLQSNYDRCKLRPS